MFTALFFKEWKEKVLLFFFELGILALLVAAQFVVREKRDIREWLSYAVLLLFYPFAALILGAAGFEAEYRQGAWAYLFSRPVGKAKVWLSKFAALLSMLAALWLVFVALWAAVPGVRAIRAWPTIGKAGLTLESAFPWWSVLVSGFLLTVAFSLSLLHGRQFNLLFLSLFSGLCLAAGVWAVMTTKAGGFLAWIAPEKALSTFFLFVVLIALAFAASSILTLVGSDFSQPRKLARGFVRWFAAFLVLAVAGTAAWALLIPSPGSRFLYRIASFGDEAYYETGRGIFKYSAGADRVQWLAKGRDSGLSWATGVAGRKLAYVGYDIKSYKDVEEDLWVADTDGRHRKRIIGGGAGQGWPDDVSISGLLLSPDGSRIAILSSGYRKTPQARKSAPLWLASTDGTWLKNLPDNPGVFAYSKTSCWVSPIAWAMDGGAILFYRTGYSRPRTSSLWLYEVKAGTARMLLDNAAPASWGQSLSPDGRLLAISYQKDQEGAWTLGLLDLKSLQGADVTRDVNSDVGRFTSQISWSPEGGRLACVRRRHQASGLDAYVLDVLSVSAGKSVAEGAMTKTEAVAQLYSPAWTGDGNRIVILDRVAHALRVLGPDLGEAGRIDLPRGVTSPVSLDVVGDKALVRDDVAEALWRVDLGTKRWKRLY